MPKPKKVEVSPDEITDQFLAFISDKGYYLVCYFTDHEGLKFAVHDKNGLFRQMRVVFLKTWTWFPFMEL